MREINPNVAYFGLLTIYAGTGETQCLHHHSHKNAVPSIREERNFGLGFPAFHVRMKFGLGFGSSSSYYSL